MLSAVFASICILPEEKDIHDNSKNNTKLVLLWDYLNYFK